MGTNKEHHAKLRETIGRKKAVIWDFDGVIGYIDWEHDGSSEVWFETLWTLLEGFDPGIRSKFPDGLKYYYEHTDDIVARFGQAALSKINEFYLQKESAAVKTSTMNPAIENLIRDMDPWIENYIWSNNQGKTILTLLEKAGIRDRFTSVVSRDTVTLAKPNLDGFSIIRGYSETAIADFLFVGDSLDTDGLAAKKLGMDFFLYENDKSADYSHLLAK